METITMQKNPISGQGEALSRPRHVEIEETKARIAQWCSWFDMPPPKVRVRKGELLFTPELQNWMDAADMSLDWAFMGNAKVMGMAYRARRQGERDARIIASAFDPDEKRMLIVALKSVGEGLISNEDAIAAFTTAIQERRAVSKS